MARITGLEFGEKFHACRVRMLFQPLNHLCPVGRAALRTAATSWSSFCWVAMFAWTNDDASGTGLRSPCFYAFHQPPVLPRMKTPWELRAQFLEELRGCDIGVRSRRQHTSGQTMFNAWNARVPRSA